jgi:DNA polymerase I-like protein with 3'-5' exonuclease and polymerase domains
MVLPIHDEIIFSIDRKALPYLPDIYKAINNIMTSMPEIKAPMSVEWKMTATTWDQAQEAK